MSAAHDGGGEALAEALEYAAAGYVLGPVTIRLDERGKKVADFHTRWQYPKAGRVDVSGDPDQLATWARQHPGCGFHLPCGPNGIVIAEGDVKRKPSGEIATDGRRSWRAAGGPRSPMTVQTQGGGEHWYFRAPEGEPIGNSAGRVPGVPHVDVRGEGGTVFASGTHVQGGGTYAANRIVPRDALPELGEQWAEKLRRAGPVRAERVASVGVAATERRPRLVSASRVKDQAWIEAKVDDELRELARASEGGFRARLFEAAAIVYRAVGTGVVSEEEADERLTRAIDRAWGAAPDDDDRKWIAEGRATAEADPWRLLVERELEPSPEVDDEGEPLSAEELEERALRREVDELRRRQTALRRLAAEDAPPLRVMSFSAFLEAPRPVPLVPGVFYRDSLSRIFGAPGCGKSFLAMDLACSIATGRPWRDEELERGSVFFVMAEGQAVNVQRAVAWCERNRVDPAELEGRFFAIPDAVQLTDEGVRDLLEHCERERPSLVVLDTKNAMMIGEENSASDTATMRRALDAIRKASGGACVVLIDHTGHEGTRARGSSAATAAMDTELRVVKGDGSPPLITAEVTRDKAAEAGAQWRWHLRMWPPAAVLVETTLEEDERENPLAPTWEEAEGVIVPTELLHLDVRGGKALPDLARFLAHDANPLFGDMDGVGVSRVEAVRALKGRHHETSVRRAWSILRERGHIEAVEGQGDTGRHTWQG